MADTPTSSGTRAYRMLTPERAYWRESIAMKIPNTNLAEQLGATRLGMRLWRLPPWSANTLHRHAAQEEVFVVLRGTGRLRVGEDTLTVPEGGAVAGPTGGPPAAMQRQRRRGALARGRCAVQ